MSSIVDIEEVVDADPTRVLYVRDGQGPNWGRFLVQFWTGTGHPGGQGPCEEIMGSRLTSWDCQRSDDYRENRCELLIPYYAKWMTITSSPDNTNIHWTLA